MSSGELKLYAFLSDEVRDLIEKVLKVKPEDRATISSIEKHPWIQKQIAQNNLYIRESLKGIEEKKISKNKEKTQNNYTGRI